jgi:hypothetical protein
MIMKLDTESVENTDHFIGIIENPENALFENPTESDYSLRESSAAINAGKAIGVEFDLIGTFRDANPDLGAYEYLP